MLGHSSLRFILNSKDGIGCYFQVTSSWWSIVALLSAKYRTAWDHKLYITLWSSQVTEGWNDVHISHFYIMCFLLDSDKHMCKRSTLRRWKEELLSYQHDMITAMCCDYVLLCVKCVILWTAHCLLQRGHHQLQFTCARGDECKYTQPVKVSCCISFFPSVWATLTAFIVILLTFTLIIQLIMLLKWSAAEISKNHSRL